MSPPPPPPEGPAQQAKTTVHDLRGEEHIRLLVLCCDLDLEGVVQLDESAVMEDVASTAASVLPEAHPQFLAVFSHCGALSWPGAQWSIAARGTTTSAVVAASSASRAHRRCE